MIEISLEGYVEQIKAKIGDHIFIVSELGAIDELGIVQAQARLESLNNKKGKSTKQEADEISKLADRVSSIMLSMFDDGQGGEITRKVLGKLSNEKLRELRDTIIAQHKAKKSKGNDGDKA